MPTPKKSRLVAVLNFLHGAGSAAGTAFDANAIKLYEKRPIGVGEANADHSVPSVDLRGRLRDAIVNFEKYYGSINAQTRVKYGGDEC